MGNIKEEKIIKTLLFKGISSISELVEKTKIPHKSLYRIISGLETRGIVEMVGNNARGRKYKVNPVNTPPAITANFRQELGVLIDGMAELSETSDPENSVVLETFVKSGIFSRDEFTKLKGLYEGNWEEFNFLRNEKEEEFCSPTQILNLMDSTKKSGGGPNCQNEIVKMRIESENDKISKLEEAETLESRALQDLFVKMRTNAVGQYSIIYNIKRNIEYNNIYKILTDRTHCQNENKESDPISFVKIFKKLFQGFLSDLPEEKRASFKPEVFGEMLLKVLFEEPALFEEEGTPEEKALPFKKPTGVKTRKKKPLPKKPKRPSKSQIQAEWDEKTTAQRMHPDFWKFDSVERDYEFAKTYVDVVRRMEGDSKASTWHLKLAINSVNDFTHPGREQKKYVKAAHEARIKADMNGARYLDWILARFNAWESSKHKKAASYPPIRNMASEMQSESWEGYLKSIKGSVLLYTRLSLEEMELPFLLPENFHADGHLEKAKVKAGDPSADQQKIREYDLQCKLYEDFIFEDMKRIHDDTGGRLDCVGQIKKAIRQKIIPADWVYGFASHHNLPKLKSAKHLIKL